ncbi:MAG: histidinol phosphate phosphatase domain-containing protein [Candidatus Syntropharchaeia archaeon]
MVFDFHTHTVFSDGELIPAEMIRRAEIIGYDAIALTDHVDFSNVEHVLEGMKKIKILEEEVEVRVIIGVEITHVPPGKLEKLVSIARKSGAELIVVHGETIVEPVEEGTNIAAVKNPEVDILAHPGLITPEEAEIARENEVYIEITSRAGHSLTNGHVARISMDVGAKLLLNTDAHSPEDLITDDFAFRIVVGTGMDEKEAEIVLRRNPEELMGKIC